MKKEKGIYPSQLICLLACGGIILVMLLNNLTGEELLSSIMGISLTVVISYVILGTDLRKKILYKKG